MDKQRLLLAQCYQTTSIHDFTFKDLDAYRHYLVEKYPDVPISPVPFQKPAIWPDRFSIRYNKDGINTAGRYIAANLKTPTKVIDQPATPEIILNALKENDYTHVGLGIYVDGYSDFIRCASAIRKYHPQVKIIAGNVGAMFPGTDNNADLICHGDGIAFLRELFGEPVDAPRKLVIIPSHVHTEILGLSIRSEAIQLVTKIGCPQSCDFCVTNKLFDNKYSGSYFTPQQVHDAIIKHAREIKKPFKIGFSEPTAIISRDWWYELFHLFEDEDGDYPVIIATTASSLNGFEFKTVMDSALRIEMVNIGVESFNTMYGKNRNLDLKALIKRLGDYGISSYAT
nr:hypothetical protein [Candidatus Sigynarchaeota archaeon]